MVFFIVLTNDRLDKITKFQLVTGDLIQFILFYDGQDQELFRLLQLIDIGTRNLRKELFYFPILVVLYIPEIAYLWEWQETFLIHPLMKGCVQMCRFHCMNISRY